MNIATVILSYPPLRRIGAELYDHELHKALQEAGHTVHVFTREQGLKDSWEFEGVLVNPERLEEYDLILTHIDCRQSAWHFFRTGNGKPTPIVGILHNLSPSTIMSESLYKWDGIIYNSDYAKSLGKAQTANKTVLIPPAPAVGRTSLSKGTAITVVNLNVAKGGKEFWKIAKANPNQEFIAVKGGWGFQIVPDVIPANVTVLEHQPNLDKVWEKTKAHLLLAMDIESWNMTASEAMRKGIPTLTFETLGGVLENLGPTSITVSNPGQVSDILPTLSAPSKAVQSQARKNHTRFVAQLDNTVTWLTDLMTKAIH